MVPDSLSDLVFDFENFNPENRESSGSRNSVMEKAKKQVNIFENLKMVQDFIETKRYAWNQENLVSEFLLDYELLYSYFPSEIGAPFDYFTLKIREIKNLSQKTPRNNDEKSLENLAQREAVMQKPTDLLLRDQTFNEIALQHQSNPRNLDLNGGDSSFNLQNLLILSPVADSSRPLRENNSFRSENQQKLQL